MPVDVVEVSEVNYEDMVVKGHGQELPQKVKQGFGMMADRESLAAE